MSARGAEAQTQVRRRAHAGRRVKLLKRWPTARSENEHAAAADASLRSTGSARRWSGPRAPSDAVELIVVDARDQIVARPGAH